MTDLAEVAHVEADRREGRLRFEARGEALKVGALRVADVEPAEFHALRYRNGPPLYSVCPNPQQPF